MTEGAGSKRHQHAADHALRTPTPVRAREQICADGAPGRQAGAKLVTLRRYDRVCNGPDNDLQGNRDAEDPTQAPQETRHLTHVPAIRPFAAARRENTFTVLLEQVAGDVLSAIGAHYPRQERLRPRRRIDGQVGLTYARLFSGHVSPRQMLSIVVFESLSARMPAAVTL